MQNNRFPLSYFPPLLAAVALGLDVLAGIVARGRFVPLYACGIAAWVAWQPYLTPLLVPALLPLAWMALRKWDARWALACAAVVCKCAA